MLSLFSHYRFSLAVDYINEGFTTEMLFRSFPILTYKIRNASKQWDQKPLRHVIRPSFMYVHVYPRSDTFHRRRINRKLDVEFEGLERFPQSFIWSYSIVITPITHIRVRLMALYITSTFIVLYKIWCQFHWISKSADLPQHFKCSHSLPNISNQIRWALDLRWQRPDQPFGLYGLKDGLLLRKDGKNVEPDWEKFESVDRTTVQKKSVEGFVDVSCLIPRITITCTLTWIYSIVV